MFITDSIRTVFQDHARRGLACFAVDIAHTTGHLRYCTGQHGVTIGGDLYSPRGMTIPKLDIRAGNNDTEIKIADNHAETDSLVNLHHANRFSGELMTWYFLIRSADGAGWQQIYSFSWTIKSCSFKEREPEFSFLLSGATGTNPRGALEVITRSCGLIFKGALCGYTGATYKSCNGSAADCKLRGREASFRGALMALEPGEEIQFYNRESGGYRVGGGGYTPPPPPGGTLIPIPRSAWTDTSIDISPPVSDAPAPVGQMDQPGGTESV